MKKICILSNHIHPFHVGGSEIVIKNVSEELVLKGYEVHVYGWDVKEDIVQNGVFIKKLSLEKFLYILNNYDSHIIYSDAFLQLSNLIRINESLNKKLILFPVGFTGAKASSMLMNLIIKNTNDISFVCHDEKYVDAELLRELKLPYSIISNGISSKEFNNLFKQRSLSENLKLLCVANTFPKKGHPELFKTCDLLYQKMNFSLSIYCNTPSWDVGKRLQQQIINHAKSRPYKVEVLVDQKREDVIKGYYNHDLFVFCSLKEVAPLCILESCAAGLPWVSFDVGNVSDIKGGLVNKLGKKDSGNYVMPSEETFQKHVSLIQDILQKDVYSKMSKEAFDFVQDKFWESLVNKYEQVIENHREKKLQCK